MTTAEPDLTAEQVAHFVEYGYVTLHDCYSQQAAQTLVDEAYQVLGYDPNAATTWQRELFIGEAGADPLLRDFSPRLWSAICQLVGGEYRVRTPAMTLGSWVINFTRGADTPWQPPSAALAGWHTDGIGHRHFLDSPEQGLLVLPLLSDVGPRGGGTFLAADSLPVMAAYLHDHTEGVLPGAIPYPELVSQCREFRETTGHIGDVTLAHPHLLHNFSQNHSGRPRFMKNINIQLREPMCFRREDSAAYSPVELAVLHSLGVKSLDFQITAPRETLDLS